MNNLTKRNSYVARTPWDLFKEMDEMFNGTSDASWSNETYSPAIDVQENDKAYLMAFDVPGLSEKDVKIEVKDGMLMVSGERKRDETTKGEGWTRTERSFGSFSRSFTLPDSVDTSKMEAQVENGELHLLIPKTEAAKPMSIPVKAKGSSDEEKKISLKDRFFSPKEKTVMGEQKH